MEANIQNYEYQPNSKVHGMVFDPTETYLYSADMGADKIWTHKKDGHSGKLTLVGSIDAPSPGDHPRWVAIHPSGTYLYALMEAGNRLAVYVIDSQSHMTVFTHITCPLIPPGTQIPRRAPPAPESKLTHNTRYPKPENVPLRRRRPLPQREIPLRNLARQLLRSHRLYRCFRTRRRR